MGHLDDVTVDPAITIGQEGQSAIVSQLPATTRYTPLSPASSTPVSMANSTSAASTVYAVHYHTANESTPPIPERMFGYEDGDNRRHTMTLEPHPSAVA